MKQLSLDKASALVHVYMSQNVRSEGILQSDCSTFQESIDWLLKEGYLSEHRWYRHELFRVTEIGTQFAKQIILKRLDDSGREVKAFLESRHEKIILFLIKHYFLKVKPNELSYPVHLEHLYDISDLYDRRYDCLVKNFNEVWFTVCSMLEKLHELGLAVLAHSYVSTRGGKVREKRYCVTPEVLFFLQSFLAEKGGFSFPAELEIAHKMYHELRDNPLTNDRLLQAGVSFEILDELLNLDLITKDQWGYSVSNQMLYNAYLKEKYLEPIYGFIKEPRAGLEGPLLPETPYTNLKRFYDLLTRCSGDLLVLDKHFDEVGIDHLNEIDPVKIKMIKILSTTEHMSTRFRRFLKAFKQEMENKGVIVKLRILQPKDAEQIHDRYIISASHAYNIPPLNVIEKRLAHIKNISPDEIRPLFDKYWSRSTKIENIEFGQ